MYFGFTGKSLARGEALLAIFKQRAEASASCARSDNGDGTRIKQRMQIVIEVHGVGRSKKPDGRFKSKSGGNSVAKNVSKMPNASADFFASE